MLAPTHTGPRRRRPRQSHSPRGSSAGTSHKPPRSPRGATRYISVEKTRPRCSPQAFTGSHFVPRTVASDTTRMLPGAQRGTIVKTTRVESQVSTGKQQRPRPSSDGYPVLVGTCSPTLSPRAQPVAQGARFPGSFPGRDTLPQGLWSKRRWLTGQQTCRCRLPRPLSYCRTHGLTPEVFVGPRLAVTASIPESALETGPGRDRPPVLSRAADPTGTLTWSNTIVHP